MGNKKGRAKLISICIFRQRMLGAIDPDSEAVVRAIEVGDVVADRPLALKPRAVETPVARSVPQQLLSFEECELCLSAWDLML